MSSHQHREIRGRKSTNTAKAGSLHTTTEEALFVLPFLFFFVLHVWWALHRIARAAPHLHIIPLPYGPRIMFTVLPVPTFTGGMLWPARYTLVLPILVREVREWKCGQPYLYRVLLLYSPPPPSLLPLRIPFRMGRR